MHGAALALEQTVVSLLPNSPDDAQDDAHDECGALSYAPAPASVEDAPTKCAAAMVPERSKNNPSRRVSSTI